MARIIVPWFIKCYEGKEWMSNFKVERTLIIECSMDLLQLLRLRLIKFTS